MLRLVWLPLVLSVVCAAVFAEEKEQDHELSRVEKSLLKALNAARVKHDKPELVADAKLNAVAHAYAVKMGDRRELSHFLDEQTPSGRVEAAGYVWAGIAENIAVGYERPADAVQGWLDSPGHKRNLLDETDRGYTQIGLGMAKGIDGQWYYCTVFAKPR